MTCQVLNPGPINLFAIQATQSNLLDPHPGPPAPGPPAPKAPPRPGPARPGPARPGLYLLYKGPGPPAPKAPGPPAKGLKWPRPRPRQNGPWEKCAGGLALFFGRWAYITKKSVSGGKCYNLLFPGHLCYLSPDRPKKKFSSRLTCHIYQC